MRRLLQGIAQSSSKDKTVSVRVDRFVMHPKYKKRYTISKKYLVHDEKGLVKKGDPVTFKETRPISKRKRWVLVETKSAQ